jgi:hypothetical protein
MTASARAKLTFVMRVCIVLFIFPLATYILSGFLFMLFMTVTLLVIALICYLMLRHAGPSSDQPSAVEEYDYSAADIASSQGSDRGAGSHHQNEHHHHSNGHHVQQNGGQHSGGWSGHH